MERSRREGRERERGLKTCTCNKISERGERERQTERKEGGGERQRQLEKRGGRKKKTKKDSRYKKLTSAGCELPKIQKSPVSE